MNDAAKAGRHLGSDRLAQALRAGIHRVIREQETLNAINVFPVPDGDTGTNLSLSLGAALGTLQRPPGQHVGALLAALADVLLDSARGNSGAIVAQFFQGVADTAEQLTRFTAHSFAQAVTCGGDYARDAMSEPREGTILSVIAAFSGSLERQTATGDVLDFPSLFSNALGECRRALVRTQSQLDELRKAGVVDAGAKGFVALIEGMHEFLATGRVEPLPERAAQEIAAAEPAPAAGESAYRYCTECLVTGEAIDRRKLREALAALGDSLVLAGTARKAKIHIHVDDPERVFAVARNFGRLGAEKADDMRRQAGARSAAARFAVITDSAADIDDGELERHDIHMVPLRVHFGERGYLDKISISAEEFFAELDQNPLHPTTSQPSPGDFRRQFQFLASHFPDVISINVTGRVSGTLQAAQSAAERITAGGRVHVVNSLNASLGQGLIAVFAAECAAAGLDAATTLRALDSVIAETYTFALVRDLRYGVRGGRVPASRKLLADLLRLTPVLRTEPDGRISAAGVLPGRRALLPRFARYVAARIDLSATWRIAVAHARAESQAREFEQELRARIPAVSRSSVTELGSALGAHSGPGAILVSVQKQRRPEEFVA